MRQRLAIWFLLPCLALAWPSVPLVYAQVSGLLAPADPEASGVRRDVKTAQRAQGAQPARQPGAAEQPGAAPDGQTAAPDGSAEAPAPPAQKLDKWNDAHSNAMRQFKNGFISWPKLLLILIIILIWVKSADWVNRDSQLFEL